MVPGQEANGSNLGISFNIFYTIIRIALIINLKLIDITHRRSDR